MNILSIDTALRSCSIGVMRGDKVVLSEIQPMSRGQDQALAIMVEQALQKSHIALSDLSAIAVTTGPGSFTGIRIGLAFARGLVSVLQIPLIGLTTAQVLAYQKQGQIAVVIEIKKDAYIVQIFNNGKEQTELQPMNIVELRLFLTKNQIKSIVTHSENLSNMLAIDCDVFIPNPSAMLEIVSKQYDIGEVNVIVRPTYIRSADVTIKNTEN